MASARWLQRLSTSWDGLRMRSNDNLHGERDSVRGAYNYAQHLPERRKMMQAWADYLNGLAAGAEVIPQRKD